MRRRRNGFAVVDALDEIIALVYKRVSSDDQEKDGLSLPAQDDETLAYVARCGMTFGGAYQDVETGANPLRRDYQRMKAEARRLRAEGKRVAIVAVVQSRFGRNIEELGAVWRELRTELGVEIHATRTGGQIVHPSMFLFQGVMDHLQLEVISAGVKGAWARLRRAGWPKGGKPRWGYKLVDATAEDRANGSPMRIPVPHDDEAPYVMELFRRRANGESVRKLSAWVQSLPASARGGREMSASVVRDALDAPFYVARHPLDGDGDVLDQPVGRWEPLVTDEVWRAIHPRDGERENVVPLAIRSEYPLTHFLFCECGGRMCGQLRGGHVRVRPGRRDYTDPVKRVYVCTSRMDGASRRAGRDGRCHRTITADLIERQVFEQFRSLLGVLRTPMMREYARLAAREEELRERANGPEKRLLKLREDRASCSLKRAALTTALAMREIDADMYAEAKAPLDDEIAGIEAEMARLAGIAVRLERKARERPEIEVILDQAEFWASALEAGTTDDRRAFLKLVLESATPRRIRPGEYVAGLRLTGLGYRLVSVGAGLLEAAGRVEEGRRAWANCALSTRPDSDGPAETERPALLTVEDFGCTSRHVAAAASSPSRLRHGCSGHHR